MSDPKGRIRAAIIGFGVSGELSHAYGLQANPEFEIAAVCDLSPERRAKAEKMLGCPTFADHQTLLKETKDLQLACVVTRSDTHLEVASDFLRAGVSTLITKPWVLDQEEAEALLAVRSESGAHLFPWVPMYWSHEFRKIRELIGSGSIGKVFMLRRQLSDFRRREDWQTERRFGGGYLLNWGPHIVQPLVALAQSPLLRVHGHLQKMLNPGDADDAFLSMLEFEDGCLGIAEFTQACEGLPSFMVQGDKGMIRSDGKTITLLQKDPSDPEPPRVTSFAIEGKVFGDEADIYKDIVLALAHGGSYAATPEDALYNTRILDAIRISHENKESVELATRSLH